MTKLQKRPPSGSPAYPSLSTDTIDGEGGIRYESLPQDTQQPIPLAISPDQHAVSGALGSNNPYSTARLTEPPNFQVFSPVSPLDVTEAPRASLPPNQIYTPQPLRQSMDAPKSAELRPWDRGPHNTEKARKVKVARDMHEGALPPAYKRTASDPIDPAGVGQAVGNGKPKHESTASNAPHSPATSQGTNVSRRLVPSVLFPRHATEAGPSAMPAQGHHRQCCEKCGKKKKPATAPLQQEWFGGIPSAPNSAHLPATHQSRPSHPGISISQVLNSNGVNPRIDVIPSSASTYHPRSLQSPHSQYGDETPLVAKAQEQRFSLFRNSSLVRSLSRRLSSKSKRDSGPLPSQQLRASQMVNGEQHGTGRLINMISKAINDSGDDHQQYARLGVHECQSRPSSPFSFQETPNENDGYEMKDMKDGNGKTTSPTSPRTETSVHSPVIMEETLDVDVDRRSRAMEEGRQANAGRLGVPGQDGSRPQITRFKSLRQGVNRAASVTRSTSLRRLASLKTVHTAWYRDDLAIEGHNGESVPVF